MEWFNMFTDVVTSDAGGVIITALLGAFGVPAVAAGRYFMAAKGVAKVVKTFSDEDTPFTKEQLNKDKQQAKGAAKKFIEKA